uniref:Uncharacterized protein n=1 Tax=Favella ehrenbergii TaxID=182087 RepID=A0A7S3MJI4_9SPIT|mmetsp:Transcript_16465/g.20862  ORF Transcript_16465/g.20862 Transcript_16465/m.20862 type:complete len:518 (+) Transcript_16465:229-1782(+)
MDYSQQEAFLEHATEHHMLKASKILQGESPTATCETRAPEESPSDFGMLLPVFAAEVSAANPKMTYKGRCFDEISFEYEALTETSFNVNVTTANPRSKLCKDVILFANTEIQHFEVFFFHGTHKLTFQMNTPEAQADVGVGGIKAFAFCENVIQDIESLFTTIKAFLGGISDHPHLPYIGSHVPPYMEKANVKFIKEAIGWELQERPTQKVDIDPDLIQSGDFFGIMRLDGLDPMIMYGTGSRVGHNVMALRFDGELYVVESQDAWYWPTHGLQRTKWADWIKYAENADFHVTWHPLNDEARAKFDEKKANDFFHKTEGLPYGYHNFLYGWVDTANDNWPPLLAKEFVPVMFKLVEDIKPTLAYNFFTEALNKRMGVDGKNISEMAGLAAESGLTVEELMAAPEQDFWEYTGLEPRDGWNWVCSAYVAAMYKEAGVFGDMEIQSTEFATMDIYIMKLFDQTTPRPEACVAADPDLPYCQLRGKYRIELPYYNSIAPYDHMFETCAINYPTYERDAGC